MMQILRLLVIVDVILACLFAGQLYVEFIADDSKGDETTLNTDAASTVAQNNIASRNTKRQNDVSRLLAGGQEYASNNVGTLPIAFEDGALRGTDPDETPATVQLGYYTTAEVNFGKQPAVEGDSIVLVTGAACGQNGETIDGSSRQLAVQYGSETPRGTFVGVCTE
jgi:hypothetical protein